MAALSSVGGQKSGDTCPYVGRRVPDKDLLGQKYKMGEVGVPLGFLRALNSWRVGGGSSSRVGPSQGLLDALELREHRVSELRHTGLGPSANS